MQSTLNRPHTTFPDAETTLGLNLSRQMRNPGGNAHDIKKAVVNGIRASAASIAKRYGPILNDPESSDALCSLVHIAQLLAENCEMQEPVAAVGLEMIQLTGISHEETSKMRARPTRDPGLLHLCALLSADMSRYVLNT